MNGPNPELRYYRRLLVDSDTAGDRVLIRGKLGTLRWFGLLAVPSVPIAYERNGGFHVGKYQYGAADTRWRTIKIVVPEFWPVNKRPRAWAIQVNRKFSYRHLCDLIPYIEASGQEFIGFYDANNSWLMKCFKNGDKRVGGGFGSALVAGT